MSPPSQLFVSSSSFLAAAATTTASISSTITAATFPRHRTLRTAPRAPPRRVRLVPHATAISEAPTRLTGRNGLPNARDLSSASSLITPDRVYRGAAPASIAGPPHRDASLLLRSASVLLDLRSRDERAMEAPTALRDVAGDDAASRLSHVALLNKRRVVWGLARTLDTSQRWDLARRVASRPVSARATVVHAVDAGGLLLLNRILVEAGGTQIARALRRVVRALTEAPHRRVYVFCSAGKDRTGLLAALLLSLLGVRDDLIVRDYHRSEHMWADDAACQLRVDYEQRLILHGLSPKQWLGAPPEVMEDTLSYIRRRFGGVEDYLRINGFGESEWDALRDALCAT